MINSSSSVEAVGHNMFEALARTFPVVCATDEFFYFPQVRLPEPQWSTWDFFYSETVAEFVWRLSAWEDDALYTYVVFTCPGYATELQMSREAILGA